MSRYMKCVKFEAKLLYKSLLTFLAFYFGIYLLLVAVIFFAIDGNNGNGNVNLSFYIGGSIFAFVIATYSYKSVFNNLLMFGSTRRNIILSNFTVYAVFSAVLSIITIVSGFLDEFVAKVCRFESMSMNSSSILNLIYKTKANIFEELLWYLAFFIMLLSFSMLFGTLSYKFGKVFITVFWVGFGLSFMLGPYAYVSLIKFVFSLDNPNGILLAPVYFVVFALIFGSAAYLIATKQSQNV